MSELERRRHLSFRQAEGIDELPRQLRKDEITPRLRSAVWNAFYREIVDGFGDYGVVYTNSRIYGICQDWHSQIEYGNDDEFNVHDTYEKIMHNLKEGAYVDFYEAVQFLIRSDRISHDASDLIISALDENQAAYRIIQQTLVPVGSEEEYRAFVGAIDILKDAGMSGASLHLTQAASALSGGRWADAVREATHAVESVARSIAGTKDVAAALNKIAEQVHIHKAMIEAFKKLYGYASDEKGVRHAMLKDGDAKVTEEMRCLCWGHVRLLPPISLRMDARQG